MRYTISLRSNVPNLLFRYQWDEGAWGWTSMIDRVHWLTLEGAKAFVAGRDNTGLYAILSEDDVTALLVGRELAGGDV